MASADKVVKSIKKLGPKLDVNSKLSISIVICFATSILLYLSIAGLAGNFGALIAQILALFFGWGKLLLPIGFIVAGVILLRIQKIPDLVGDVNSRMSWGLILMFASLTGILNIIFKVTNFGEMSRGGGLLGYFLYPLILGNLSWIGGTFVLLSLALIGFFLVSQLTASEFFDKIKELGKDPAKFWDLVPDIFEVWNGSPKSTNPQSEEFVKNLKSLNETIKITPAKKILEDEKLAKAEADKELQAESLQPRASKANALPLLWKLPPFEILSSHKNKVEAGDIEGNKKIIKETLSHFGISVEMAEATTGPTVTQYTFKPANGVKLSTIDSLQRDMALALAVNNIRLEAPVAGQSLVGVEIPNKIKSMVRLRDLLQTQGFVNFQGQLPVAIGKDVAGHNLIVSLAKMPHLLVAGATGAGKSVWINAMLLSLLYRYSPQDLQMILVDMKRVELKLYEGIPHLLASVITDAEKAVNALKWTVLEMDRRYKLLEEHGKRNIQDYNDFVHEASPEMDLDLMPYIVFVVDELGDLMMLAKTEVEPIIVRLTQMSRAVGIHIVLGTQRPDTHVVTGLIKANIPTRIAFAVASQIDSRVILDVGGAEKLLGQGDGMIMSPTSMLPIRFQGPVVEEVEVRKCVQFLKDQAALNHLHSNLDINVIEPPRVKINVPGMSSVSGFGDDDVESSYEEAKRLVIQYQKASTSFLQQMMGVGYPKAAKIIQQLEDAGIVGPANGSKPREVYMMAE